MSSLTKRMRNSLKEDFQDDFMYGEEKENKRNNKRNNKRKNSNIKSLKQKKGVQTVIGQLEPPPRRFTPVDANKRKAKKMKRKNVQNVNPPAERMSYREILSDPLREAGDWNKNTGHDQATKNKFANNPEVQAIMLQMMEDAKKKGELDNFTKEVRGNLRKTLKVKPRKVRHTRKKKRSPFRMGGKKTRKHVKRRRRTKRKRVKRRRRTRRRR